MGERSEERERERERVNDERPQERVSISVEKKRKQCRKIPNWKAPERETVSKDMDQEPQQSARTCFFTNE